MMNHEGWFFGGGFMGLVWILVIAVFVLLIVFVAKGVNKEATGYKSDVDKLNDPLQILKLRYARGEIDQDEYERLKSALEE